jgi:hypothetical protein
MKTITLTVTREDIRNGVQYNSYSCPVALALGRAYHGSPGAANVGYTEFSLSDGKEWCKAPVWLSRFMHGFDKGEKVRPFKRVLRLRPVK